MPVLPKSIMVLGASIQTAQTARRLKRNSTSVREQWENFQTLISQFATTEFGRSAQMERGMDYAKFKSRVPVRSYEQLASQIENMKSGSSNVLWPGRCSLFVTSAGTTGQPKSLPVTNEMRAHFQRASLSALFFYTARTGRSTVFRGRHLLLGGATALTRSSANGEFAAEAGNLNGIKMLAMPEWIERYLFEPLVPTPALSEWSSKLDAIAAARTANDVTLVAGMPNWMLNFAEALKERLLQEKQPSGSLASVWPRLECLMHSGVPIGPFQEQLREALGIEVKFHEVYSAAEGIIAAQDTDASAGLRLITDAGLFFEFIPLREFTEAGRLGLGEKAVPLAQVRAGVDYVLLLTTPAGLCRYILGDVVRFTSTEPPRLVYVGRTELQLNAFGERVIEKEITDTLVTICGRHRWTIKNFHVAPIFATSLTGQTRGRHEWWVELRPGTIETPTGPILAVELDRELATRNSDYQAKRSSGHLEAPIVRLVMPGLFQHWMRSKDKWGSENKMPRCRSDRLIADELMALACFTD